MSRRLVGAQDSLSKSAVKAILIWIILFALPLFIAAGTANWWNAWAYLVINLGSISFLYGVIYKNTPGLAHERATARANTKIWDKVLVPLLVALLPLISIIVAGLDRRFRSTGSITTSESLVALVVYIAGII